MSTSPPESLSVDAAANIRESLAQRREIPRRYQYLGDGAAAWAVQSDRTTQAQRTLLAGHACDLAALLPRGDAYDVLELGPGDGRNTALVLNALGDVGRVAAYTAVDISPAILDLARSEIERAVRAAVPFTGLVLDFTRGPLPGRVVDPLGESPETSRVALCLGGTLSNFEDSVAVAVLTRVRDGLRGGELLVVSQRLDTPRSRADVYPSAAIPPSERFVFDALGIADTSHRMESGYCEDGRYRYHRARFVEDVVVSFEPHDLPEVLIAAGDAVELWRSRHFTEEEYRDLLARAGFAVVRAFLDPTGEYLLAACERHDA